MTSTITKRIYPWPQGPALSNAFVNAVHRTTDTRNTFGQRLDAISPGEVVRVARWHLSQIGASGEGAYTVRTLYAVLELTLGRFAAIVAENVTAPYREQGWSSSVIVAGSEDVAVRYGLGTDGRLALGYGVAA